MGPRARLTGLGLVLTAAGLLLHASPSLAVTIDLCADEGTVVLPNAPAGIQIWGFSLNPGTGCEPASLPGPVLTVNQGDVVTVNLANNLASDAVSILFPGQSLLPDTVGAPAGSSKTYTFTASAPGTYLYSAGINPDLQVPMGLYGALIVRPSGFAPTPPASKKAYGPAATAFGTEAVLVLSDLDPNLNANPHGFNLANYNPTYWLINGKAYPDTAPIPVTPGQRLLLRYVNAGSTNTAMTVVGLRQMLIAKDAFLEQFPISLASETIASGQTSDMIVVGPSTPGKYPLYNRQMHITNGIPNLTPPPAAGEDRGIAAPHFPGGMMTFISVPNLLFFSTAGNTTVPGVLTPYDNADIYGWSGAGGAYTRLLDGTGVGLAAGADIDALVVIDADTFYMSFATDAGTVVPTLGLVQDEDVVKYDAGTWTMYFDGSNVGLGSATGAGSNAEDVDAFEILGAGSILVSTRGAPTVPGLVTPPLPQDEDLLRCDATFPVPLTCTWTMYFEGSDVGLATTDLTYDEDVDGVAISGADIYLSTNGNFLVPGLTGQGRDVFVCKAAVTGPVTSCAGGFSMFFDGSAQGLTTGTIDAIDLP